MIKIVYIVRTPNEDSFENVIVGTYAESFDYFEDAEKKIRNEIFEQECKVWHDIWACNPAIESFGITMSKAQEGEYIITKTVDGKLGAQTRYIPVGEQ